MRSLMDVALLTRIREQVVPISIETVILAIGFFTFMKMPRGEPQEILLPGSCCSLPFVSCSLSSRQSPLSSDRTPGTGPVHFSPGCSRSPYSLFPRISCCAQRRWCLFTPTPHCISPFFRQSAALRVIVLQ